MKRIMLKCMNKMPCCLLGVMKVPESVFFWQLVIERLICFQLCSGRDSEKYVLLQLHHFRIKLLIDFQALIKYAGRGSLKPQFPPFLFHHIVLRNCCIIS